MGDGTPPPLVFTVRSEDDDREDDFFMAFHAPGVIPVIPRVGEEMWLKGADGEPEMFIVSRVVYYSRDHECIWRNGRIEPGTYSGRDGMLIAPGITEVQVIVRPIAPAPPAEPE